MNVMFPEGPLSPPEAKPPCQCNINALKKQIEEVMNDEMFCMNLEWRVNFKSAEKALEDYLKMVVERVEGMCSECKPEKDNRDE